jgi:hypothetical protein
LIEQSDLSLTGFGTEPGIADQGDHHGRLPVSRFDLWQEVLLLADGLRIEEEPHAAASPPRLLVKEGVKVLSKLVDPAFGDVVRWSRPVIVVPGVAEEYVVFTVGNKSGFGLRHG